MIDERLKGVDQDKIRQEMQEQAKQRAKEPFTVEGIASSKSLSILLLEKDLYLPKRDLFYKAGTRVNPIEEMNNKLLFH